MTLDTQAAPATAADTGPLTIDQAVDRQLARKAAPPAEEEPIPGAEALSESPEADGVAQVDEQDSEAAPQAADDGEEAPETETLEAEQVQEPDPAQPKLDPPARWDAKGKELFAKLPVEAKDYILGREKLQQAEITKAQQKSAEVTKTFETRIQHLESVATSIGENYVDPGLARMKEWDDWFASDAADELAQSNPAEYLQQQNRFRREKRSLDDAIAAKSKAETQAFQAYAQEQARLIPELIPELADEVEGPKRKSELFTYLRSEGFDPERIRGISAKEAQIGWKAKKLDSLGDIDALIRDAELYRKSVKLATKPPPPKPKVNAGPSAPAAGQGQTPSSSEAQLKALMAKPNWSSEDHVRHMELKRKIGK